ncbi:AAA family ATPase [Yimella sp. cx-573]|nr:AAA family ATPase [Yimella sp. cx-573]
MSTALEAPPPDDDYQTTPADHAEQAILGALLLAAPTDDAPPPGDYRHPGHELIAHTIQAMRDDLKPVDTLTVADALGARDLLRLGGLPYLHELITKACVPASITYYRDIITEAAGRRRLATLGTQLQAAAHAPGDLPLAALLHDAAGAIDTLAGTTTTGEDTNTWAPLNLAEILASDQLDLGPRPTLLARNDGKLLLYPAAIHSISGEPASGKTWVAILAAAQELADSNDVLYIDFEDRPETLISRLRGLGIDDRQIAEHLRYIRPQAALDPASRTHLDEATQGVTLAVIDGITEAMTLHGLSLMDNEDVARWLALIPHHIANHGPSVVQIDHVVKNSEARGRYAIGGQHKLAGITGVAYKLVTVRSFGRGSHGIAKLVIDKDRHGHVGPNGSTAAEMHLDATKDGLEGWLCEPEETTYSSGGEMRPTHLMEKVSRYLEHVTEASGRQITTTIKGKDTYVRLAIKTLQDEGYITARPAARGAQNYSSVTPFRQADHDDE